ncbi:DUF1127 domain-containing protein [Natronospirillum operosum]|uniref:DUF1127 domain-containing protein n=1 Tax=Natronospirillum operosum TaxID=2759953 RepID=A0A4Z0WGT0_9GAMM|nr:DUF1127 domain-containing protein [Natronospirillum operosum]TGG93968.1 DUF1127 domain-containing protein [Natronospirillum operosum]
MTAQIPNTQIVHPIRIKLPMDGIKRIINRMIVRKQKRVLMELPDYLLRDVGLTRYDVAEELNRPFWR